MSAETAQVAWLGHAGVALRIDGVRAIIDPLLSRRLGHLRRRGPDVRDDDLLADVVLISHAHADHLHRPSLRGSRPCRRPPRSSYRPERRGMSQGWASPPSARSARGPPRCRRSRRGCRGRRSSAGRSRWSQPDTESVGYVVERSGRRAYHAGDTGVQDLTSLGRIDLACLPISGWWKTLGPGHLDPTQAAHAVESSTPRRCWRSTGAPTRRRTCDGGCPPGPGRRGGPSRPSWTSRHLLDRLLPLKPGDSADW